MADGRAGYGSLAQERPPVNAHDAIVEEFGHLPLGDRLALLEEYHDQRARASLRTQQYPCVNGVLESAAKPRPYEHTQPRHQPPGVEGRAGQRTLVALSVLIGSLSFALFSTYPIFESLRDAIGWSSLQVVLLNASPLLFASVFTLPAANFTQTSTLWEMMMISCTCLMVGTWVSACAVTGSPLEYMLLGQWFLGIAIAVMVPAPAKYAVYWCPKNGRRVTSDVWDKSVLVGMSLPFLVVPAVCGGDGHGKHLGSFLLSRAVFGTAVAAVVVGLKSSVERNAIEEEDEVEFYRASHTQSFWAAALEAARNRDLAALLLPMALTLSVALSFFMLLPFVLSLPPSGLTPLGAGLYLWALAPAGLVGIACVRAKVTFDLDSSRDYKAASLACVAACAGWLAIFAFLLERTSPLQLTMVACLFAASAGASLRVTQQAVLDLAYPVQETTSSAVASAAVLHAGGLVPLASILLTHPFVLDYATDASSPTGVVLSLTGIFWMLLLGAAFA
eukprot:CAMPEP_0172092734 /NCGR_PEP_ID=MMETSP1043-20130122/25598_1 /TAXON_ID=464988 /ORGANISM="Hemiselmis andersenii, Strain CCMP441" /LENGTH=503 /DNA_ID=CAMNT_0012755471 /DNA_START=11 /DNA_END=1518 /DNA_ORIENTATION=-